MLKVWDLEIEEVFATITCNTWPLRCALSGGLKLIIAGDAGGYLHIFRLENANPGLDAHSG